MELLKKVLKTATPHLIAVAAFVLMAFLYCLPNFKGKVHNQEDVTQSALRSTELKHYQEKEGKIPSWTNSIFSGMPSTLILGRPSQNQIVYYNYLTPFSKTEYPFRIILLSFIGFYILLNAFKIKPLYAALGAIAYGFVTYSISSIEAAHYSKVMAMALMPAVLAGLHLLFDRKYLAGFIVMAFNFSLQSYYFHYQITYYTIIMLLVFGIYYAVSAALKRDYKTLGIAVALSVLAAGLTLATNIDKIRSTERYAKETMRGGSALASSPSADTGKTKKAVSETSNDGLNPEYAFRWSYSVGETFTLLVPGIYGGSDQEKLGKNSALYELYSDDQILEGRWPLYHGDLPGTSGPIYMGAIIVFLFLLGMFIVKDPVKWPILALTLLSFMLGWGRHFSILNDFLFANLPYYNKFRTPMMAFSIAQVTMPLMAFLTLKEILTERKSYADLLRQVKLGYYILGGVLLAIVLVGPAFIDVSGSRDKDLIEQIGDKGMSALREDRASLIRTDALRSLFFISAAFALLFFWMRGKLKRSYVYIGITVLAFTDLLMVDTRYLSWSSFQYDKGEAFEPEPTAADRQIMADKDLHYRVLDVSQGNDPFNNNRGAAFHKLIGGYDAAKLSRYQELISEYIQDTTQMTALKMLNCKYAISAGKQDLVAQQVEGNYGNAWFIDKIEQTQNARAEMDALKKINPRHTAVIDINYADNKGKLPQTFTPDDSLSSIKLVSYHPDTMVYSVNANGNKYAVFSEIYFPGWKAYINDKPVDVNKVNYTLRGLPIPAGKSTVKLVFPSQVDKGTDTLVLLSSLVILGAIIAYAVLSILRLNKTPEKAV